LQEIDSNGIESDNAELFDRNGGSGQRQAIERARWIQKGEDLNFPERLRSSNSLFQARCADEGIMNQRIAPGRNTAQRQRNEMRNRNREVDQAMASPINFLIPGGTIQRMVTLNKDQDHEVLFHGKAHNGKVAKHGPA
jgi:hypothetical protein